MFKRILKNEGGEQDFFAYEIKNQCSSCGHLNRENPTQCNAFPNGIPLGILMGVIDHRYPYHYEGLSDRGLRWVPMAGLPPQDPETMFD